MIKFLLHLVLYRILMRNFLRLFLGLSYKNFNTLKNYDQFIIIANHNSHIDTMAILSALPFKKITKLHPIAAGDYFGRNKITAILTTLFVNSLLISRNKKESKNNALDEIDLLIKSGKSILIFPEGSRGIPEVIQEFKHGTSILLKRNPSVPIFPILFKGLGKALPKGDPILIPFQCEMILGRPLEFKNVIEMPVEEITQKLKDSIIELN